MHFQWAYGEFNHGSLLQNRVISYVLTSSSAAGVNLGRLIWTVRCPEPDTTFCLLNSTIFILSEITLGIVVASVPTLGPIYFSLGAKWTSRKYSKPTDNEDTPQNQHVPSIGSIPLRPRKKDDLYNDNSLLRSQPGSDQVAKEWPSQQIVPQALTGGNGPATPQSMGYLWRTEASGDTASHRVGIGSGKSVADVPYGAIMRDVEYNVHESQAYQGGSRDPQFLRQHH